MRAPSSDALPDDSTASRKATRAELERRMFPEIAVSGFSHIDQEVTFFLQVNALLNPQDVVLDFGAGRGEWFQDDPVEFRRQLQNLRGRCAHVDGCDADPVVLENPTLDAAEVIEPGKPLPYDDDRFDLIIARYVFEHIGEPQPAVDELLRVLKPGGWLCVLTPNKWGYVAMAARLVPNRLHRRVLRNVQPDRREIDVFPTRYRLNTPRALRRFFGDRAELHYFRSSYPSYHFNRTLIFRSLSFLHRILPPMLQTSLYAFLRKR